MSARLDSRDGAASVDTALRRLEAWGSARGWLGADPYEGLNARHARLLTLGGRPLPRRLLIQLVKTSPVDLRRPLGIAPQHNAKAVALVASGYARALRQLEAMSSAAGWLDRLTGMDVVAAPDQSGWGYHFDFQSRVFFYPLNAPNTIATSFAIHALLDGWDALQDDRWLAAAGRGAKFLLARMLVRRPDGAVYFRYVPDHDTLIHNASALALGAVMRAASAAARPTPPAADAALSFLLDSQRPDGSWPYGDSQALEWVDHHHTGYVLESLEHARRAGAQCREPLERGLAFYDENLFGPDGVTPLPRTGRSLPLETHNIAQAIETHAAVAGWRPASLRRAVDIATHGIAVAGKPDGSFVFERRRWWTSRVAAIRWTNAPMFRALAGLLARLEA